MRLTTFTDYALRVLLHVATAPQGRSTVAEIARAYAISEHHLVKVVHLLGKEGILVNSRGRGGGLRLAAAPEDIGVGRVVRATEGPSVLAECFDPAGHTCAIASSCSLAGVLAQANDSFYAVLDSYSLQDLVARSRPVASILHYFEKRP